MIAVPDTANTAALGYANQSGIAYELGIIRNHYVGRTFMAPQQSLREFRARVKFNTVNGVLKGKRVVVVDDSLVRGTTLKQLLIDIRKAGAAEIHVRICSPPVISPRFYGMDFPTSGELMASDRSVEQMRRFLKVDSLSFLSLEGMLGDGARVLRCVLHRQLPGAARAVRRPGGPRSWCTSAGGALRHRSIRATVGRGRMRMIDTEVPAGLADLERDGFLLVPGALDGETVAAWKRTLYELHRRGLNEIDNSVGNVAFESLLRLEPERSRRLIGHPSVAPYLKAMLGKQCQLRSLRAHLNPRAYRQEWHMDFADYHYQERHAEAGRPLRALCMNSTFYLTENTPARGRLTFLRNYVDRPLPEKLLPHVRYTDDRSNPFQTWCDEQPQEHLYPQAGDAIVFFSHIPHQGVKFGDDPEDDIRANLVLHYQQNPMYPGIRFVSSPDLTLDALGYAGTFPFAQ